jgi:hypothetical protein
VHLLVSPQYDLVVQHVIPPFEVNDASQELPGEDVLEAASQKNFMGFTPHFYRSDLWKNGDNHQKV